LLKTNNMDLFAGIPTRTLEELKHNYSVNFRVETNEYGQRTMDCSAHFEMIYPLCTKMYNNWDLFAPKYKNYPKLTLGEILMVELTNEIAKRNN
jgi:hypothetical protein